MKKTFIKYSYYGHNVDAKNYIESFGCKILRTEHASIADCIFAEIEFDKMPDFTGSRISLTDYKF